MLGRVFLPTSFLGHYYTHNVFGSGLESVVCSRYTAWALDNRSDNARLSKFMRDRRVPTQNSIYSGNIISYLIVMCKVNHLIQTVMGLEYLTPYIESAFTPTKQLLKLCLTDVELSQALSLASILSVL